MLKRISVFLLAIVLIFTQFIMLTAVSAQTGVAGIDSVPAYPEYASVEIYKEGWQNSWGDNYSWAGDRFKKDLTSSPVNLSGVSQIEFDIYIADKDAFKTAAETGQLVFVLRSGNNAYQKRSGYSFAEQVTSNGWNHIVIDITKTAFKGEKDTDFASVTYVSFTFWNGSVGSTANPIGSTVTRIANICGSNPEIDSVPAYPQNASVEIYKNGWKNSWGTNYDWAGSRFKYTLASAVDLSGVSQFEFDIYIEDKEAFQTAAEAGGLVFVVGSGDNEYKQRSGYSFAEQVTQNGWNHIVIDKNSAVKGEKDTDFTSVNRVVFTFWAGGNKANPIAETETRIVNICGIVSKIDIVPAYPQNALVEIYKDGWKNSWGTNYGWTKDRFIKDLTALPVDLSAATRFEFDIYIEDKDAFKTAAQTGDLRLVLGSSDSKYEKRSAYNFADQVTQNGWNHIVIKKENTVKDESTDFTSIKWVFFTFWDGTVDSTQNPIGSTITRIVNLCACEYEIDRVPAYPLNASVEIYKEGWQNSWGDKYNWAGDRFIKDMTASPVDLSGVSQFEFDIYIEDKDAFKAAAETGDLRLVLGSSDSRYEKRSAYNFADQVTQNGWNHIVIRKGNTVKDESTDFTNVKWVLFTFWAGGTNANPIAVTETRIVNICGASAEIDRAPSYPQSAVVEIWRDGCTKAWGDKYNWTADRFVKDMTASPVDLSGASQIEFDIYIADKDAFKMAEEAGALRLVVGSSDSKYEKRSVYQFAEQVNQDGWNHIVINLSNMWRNESTDFASVKWVMLTYWSGGSNTNPIGSTVARIANVCGTLAEYDILPELPENVLAQLGNSTDGTTAVGNTVGAYYHYAQHRLYVQKLSPVDFSQTPMIEFDIYIDDYEKFLMAENDVNDGQNSKLSFAISSTVPTLWEQYEHPYLYFNAGIDLAKYVTHSGWNHVVVGKPEFTTINHGVDWSAVTAFYVYYRGASNYYPYENPYSSLYIKVANIVNTGVVVNIPANEDSPLQPDEDAVYISSVEGLADNYGAWNTTADINVKYKTAGTASLNKKIDYTSEMNDTVMNYIFDDSVDFSDLKTLKFDLFVDVPEILNRPTNNIEIVMGNNRFAKEDYYSWNIDLTQLKAGWNEISLDIVDANAVGDPDISNIKIIMLRFTKIGLLADSFEELIYGIDNIRYLSATGNKTLNVWENNFTVDNEYIGEADTSIKNDDYGDVEKKETVVDVIGKTKYNKTVEKTVITDWLVAGIIIGVEALVLAAGVVVFIVVYRKRKNKTD